MIPSLAILVIRSQPTLKVADIKVVDEYILVEPHMINVVSLSICMDEYWGQAQEIKEDRRLDLDKEHLHSNIDNDDLLDDSEGVYMVDTPSSWLHKLPSSTISKDAYVEKDEAPNST